jgi:hypothetical protein
MIDLGLTFLYPTCCPVRIYLMLKYKQLKINVDKRFSRTVCYALEGTICRERLRTLLPAYTKQYYAHRECEQEMKLQAQIHVSIF